MIPPRSQIIGEREDPHEGETDDEIAKLDVFERIGAR